MKTSGKTAECRGFTLVEIMIVIGIIGLLAAFAIPAFLKARRESRVSRYISDLRVAIDSFEMYAMENGDYPPDRSPSQVPAGLEDYLRRFDWRAPTPIGGRWDWDHNSVGITAGVTVIGPDISMPCLRRVDERLDDGVLTTGTFRRTNAGGYSFVMID